jgi:FkbM family methyltransferase
VDTLGMNAAYRYWQQIGWYPTYYCCLDNQVVVSHADAIAKLVEERRCRRFFLHEQVLTVRPDLANYPDVVFLCQLTFGPNNKAACERFGLAHTPHEYFRSSKPAKLTTGSYSVRFAGSMGYETIGLVGIDARYVEVIPEAKSAGGIVLKIDKTPTQNANYFFSDYQQAGDVYNVPNPSVHGGNLHLQSFQAIVEDIEKYGMKLDIAVCTTASELYDQKVFRYQPLKGFLGVPYLSAVFVPFIARDSDAVVRRLRTWGVEGFTPRDLSQGWDSIGLHFAFNKMRDIELELKILEAFAEAELSRFFEAPVFHYSELDGLRDLYTRRFEGPVGPEGYMAGPNNQFFDIVSRFATGMSHILLMESDVAPIRPGWLDRVDGIVEDGERFWVCGSQYRGQGEVQALWHINGNAIYNVGDSAFRQFFDGEFLPYFRERVKRVPSLAYDLVLYDMFKALFTPKDDPEIRARWNRYGHRFRFSDFIVDVSHADDRQAGFVDLAMARASFPDTVLFHGATEAIDAAIATTVFPATADGFPTEIRRKPRRIVVVDPDAKDFFGHFLAYDVQLGTAAEKLGLPVTVLGNVEMDPSVIGGLPLEFLPTFTINSWTIGNLRRGDSASPRRFQEELASALDKVRTSHPGESLSLYLYTGSLDHARLIDEVIATSPDATANVNLFYAYNQNERTPAFAEQWRSFIEYATSGAQTSLTVPTRRLAEDYQSALEATIPVAPHPSTTFSDDDAVALFKSSARACAEPPLVLFPGGMRREKGFDLSVRAARELAADGMRVTLRTLGLRTGGAPADLASLARDLDGTGATLEDRDLDGSEFKRFLEAADIVVCPYLPSAFSRRTSGLVIDAMLLGQPVVVVKGTWLGDLAAEMNIGVAVDPTPAALANGVREVRARYDEFARSIWMARRGYFVHHSWRHLVETIVEREAVKPSTSYQASSAASREDAIWLDETALVARLFERAGGPSSVLVDVGAHHGESSAPFAERGWTVYAFEPHAGNRRRLIERLGSAPNVTIDPRALSDQNANGALLFESDESSGISGLHAFRQSHRAKGTVDVTTLADIVREKSIKHINFLKIDVEGFDFNVLKGVPWNDVSPDVIACEFEDIRTIPLGHTHKDIAAYLQGKGYSVYLSVWHPVLRYGARHSWQLLTTFPGDNLGEDAWGNILAFKDDPGFETLVAAFNEAVGRSKPGFALQSLTRTHERRIPLQRPATQKPTVETLAPVKANSIAALATQSASPTASKPPPSERLYTQFATWAASRSPITYRLGQFVMWCARTARRYLGITALAALLEASLVAAAWGGWASAWSSLLWLAAGLGVLGATVIAVVGFAGHLDRLNDARFRRYDTALRQLREAVAHARREATERDRGIGFRIDAACSTADRLGASVDDLASRFAVIEPKIQNFGARIEDLSVAEAALAKRLSGIQQTARGDAERADQLGDSLRRSPVLNSAKFQRFNRAISESDVKVLTSKWASLLGMQLAPSRVAYLAHRAGLLEGRMKGRLATTIETIVLRSLVAAASKREDLYVLEIGTLFGIGAAAVYDAATDEFDRVHMTVIDPLDGYYGEGRRDVLTGARVSEATLKENWGFAPIPADHFTIIKRLSTEPEAMVEAAKRTYDLLIIDGDHSRQGVKFDFDNYGGMVRPGGYILFDDYDTEDWPDIKAYVDEEVAGLSHLHFVGADFRTAVFQVKGTKRATGKA